MKRKLSNNKTPYDLIKKTYKEILLNQKKEDNLIFLSVLINGKIHFHCISYDGISKFVILPN